MPPKYDKEGKLQYTASVQRAQSKTPGTEPKVQDFYCKNDNVQAITSMHFNRMIFCPGLWKENPIPEIQPKVDKVRRGDPLDTYFSGSWVFAHELVHLWNDSGLLFTIDDSRNWADYVPNS